MQGDELATAEKAVVLTGQTYHRRGFTSGVALYSSCAVMTGVNNWTLWIWFH